MHRHALVLLALLCLALATACGGSPRGGERSLAWSSAVDSVPRDAAYAVAWNIDEAWQATGSVQQSLRQLEALELEPELVTLFEAVADPESIGLDPNGSVGLFSTAVFPVMVARVLDREMFSEFVAQQFDSGGLTYADTVTYGALAFDVYHEATDDDVEIEFGFVEDFAVVRFRTPDEPWAFFPDERFTAWLTGDPEPAWINGARFDAARERLPEDSELSQLIAVDIGRVAELVERTARRLSEDDQAMGLTGDDIYDGPEHREACLAGTARLVEDMPYFAGVTTVTGTDVLDLNSTMVLSTSEAMADRLRTALTPVSDALSGASAEAIFYADSGIEFLPLARAVIADRELEDCPGLVAGPAALAGAIEDESDALEEAAQSVTGAGAFALYGVELGGMIPSLDAAASFFSPDAVGVSDQLSQLLTAQGATGRIDETAPVTTIEYNLFVLTLRVMQLNDRLVLTLGDVPTAVSDAMARGERQGRVFMRAGFNGAGMLDLWRDILSYAREAGAPEEFNAQMDSVLAYYENLVEVEMTGVLGDDFIALDSSTQMRVTE